MPILIQYLFAIGAFQGILMASLLIFSKKNNNANYILGAWCFFLALRFLGMFITMEGKINDFSFLIGWSYFLPASFGAFWYLYCRHSLLTQPFRYKELWHFAPLILCWLLNIDILLASPETKLNIILSGQPQSWQYILSDFIFFSQAFVYLGLSIALLHRYQNKAEQSLSNFNPDIFAWLWKLLALNGAIWILKTLGSIFPYYSTLSTFGDILIIVLIYSIAMAQWRNPRLFNITRLEKVPHTINETLISPNDQTDNDSDDKLAQQISKNAGVLTESIRRNLLMVVKQYMEEHHTYLDNQLTLNRLAEAVAMSTHHLSEVLNQQEGKNFYQFVNEYRINYLCKQLKANPTIKIIDLALNSGFSSKSTFNAVFKQITGLTPSQYREKPKTAKTIRSHSD